MECAVRRTSSLHPFVAISAPQCSQCPCHWEITANELIRNKKNQEKFDPVKLFNMKLTSGFYSDTNT